MNATKSLRHLLGIALVAVTLPNAHAQLAVFDGAAAGNWVTQIREARNQVIELKNQYKQAKQAYDSFTGARDIGKVLQNRVLEQFLPPEFAPVLEAIKAGKDGNIPGLSRQIAQVIAAERQISCTNQHPGADMQKQREQCEALWRQFAGLRVLNEQNFKRSATNLRDMEQLLNTLVSSKDPKDAADFNNRLGLENVRLQNTQIQMATMREMREANEKMERQNALDKRTQSYNDAITSLQQPRR